MSNSRIKDMSTITPVDATYVPGDSTGTGTGKATIGTWVLAGIKSALAALSDAVTAAGTWTFSGNTTHSGTVTNSSTTTLTGATTASTIAASGAVTAASVTTTGLVSAGGGVDFTSDKGINCADPTAVQDVSTKAYTDRLGRFSWSVTDTSLICTGTTPLVIGFFYGTSGQVFSTSTVALLSRGVAGNAIMQVRVVGGSLVSGFSFSTNGLVQSINLAGAVTLAATGWYQIEIVSDNGSGTATPFGLYLQ